MTEYPGQPSNIYTTNANATNVRVTWSTNLKPRAQWCPICAGRRAIRRHGKALRKLAD